MSQTQQTQQTAQEFIEDIQYPKHTYCHIKEVDTYKLYQLQGQLAVLSGVFGQAMMKEDRTETPECTNAEMHYMLWGMHETLTNVITALNPKSNSQRSTV